jgi:hypothetical protein
MSATMSRFGSSGIALLLGALLGGSCNNDPGIQQVGGGKGGAPNFGGRPGSGSGGSGAVGGAPDRPGGTAGAGGAPGGRPDEKTCTATSAMAKQLPVDIFVLLDRSGSMLEPITGGGGVMPMPGVANKWDSMKEALTKFVQSPASAGLQLGLGYFPLDGLAQCDVNAYAMPAVPIDALPAVATPFMTSISGTIPMGRTPTRPALLGAVQYAQQREMMVNRRVAIALATDGQPNDCGSNLAAVSAVAQMASGMGIYTFVIGVGPQLQNLNAIAVAGGTKMAYLVEMATADQLAAAFKTIQMQAAKLACSFMIPPPPAGMTLDPDKVNVRFAATDPAKSFDLAMVANRAACGPQGGWYFDNVMNPKTVTLCETSCAQVNSSGEGQISLLFGCAGIVIK